MFNAFGKVIKKDNFDKIAKTFENLKKTEVLVGIPEEKSGRNKNTITNAQLAFIHSNGSPLRHIPARPFIQPAIKKNQEQIAELFKQAAIAALEGIPELAENYLNKAGLLGANVSKAWFTDPGNGWPQIQPASAKARLRKFSASYKKQNLTKMKNSALNSKGEFFKSYDVDLIDGAYTVNPLIDTEQLRKSITYIVVKG